METAWSTFSKTLLCMDIKLCRLMCDLMLMKIMGAISMIWLEKYNQWVITYVWIDKSFSFRFSLTWVNRASAVSLMSMSISKCVMLLDFSQGILTFPSHRTNLWVFAFFTLNTEVYCWATCVNIKVPFSHSKGFCIFIAKSEGWISIVVKWGDNLWPAGQLFVPLILFTGLVWKMGLIHCTIPLQSVGLCLAKIFLIGSSIRSKSICMDRPLV